MVTLPTKGLSPPHENVHLLQFQVHPQMCDLVLGQPEDRKTSRLPLSHGQSLDELSEAGGSSSLSAPSHEPWPYYDMPLNITYFPTVEVSLCEQP